MDEPLRFGGKRLLQLDSTRPAEPLPSPNVPEVDWKRVFDELRLSEDERKAVESTLELTLQNAAERLGWTCTRLRNTLDRARRRIAKSNLAGQRDQFVGSAAGSKRSLNPAYKSHSESGGSSWNLVPLGEEDFASVMRDEVLQVTEIKPSAERNAY
jgi:predicted DNA-binding protein (UPF0251 family)